MLLFAAAAVVPSDCATVMIELPGRTAYLLEAVRRFSLFCARARAAATGLRAVPPDATSVRVSPTRALDPAPSVSSLIRLSCASSRAFSRRRLSSAVNAPRAPRERPDAQTDRADTVTTATQQYAYRVSRFEFFERRAYTEKR